MKQKSRLRIPSLSRFPAGVLVAMVSLAGASMLGSGPTLFVGGDFGIAGGAAAINIVRWDGSAWSPLGSGLNDKVSALTVFNDGSGPAVFAGGTFTGASGSSFGRIAKWDGQAWSPLGLGVISAGNASPHSAIPPAVHTLRVFNFGTGPALSVGGTFTRVGGIAASHIARWDGSTWSRVGLGVSGGTHGLAGPSTGVYALAKFDDGAGPALYAGGLFSEAGGVPARGIAKWDGAAWSALGSGLGSPGFLLAEALAVFDDGRGPALYVGGMFTMAGGAPAPGIARWNGSSWSSVGDLRMSSVASLEVFDDGTGPALYAAGSINMLTNNETTSIAKWDGQAWSSLGGGINGVSFVSGSAMTVFDDGSGPALFAGGHFTSAGGAPANGLAKWDGSTWTPVSQGINSVLALAGFESTPRPALFAGGHFFGSPAGDAFLATYEVCRRPLPDFNGDGVVNAVDLSVVLVNWGPCVGACPADVTGDGMVDGVDLANVLNAWSTP